MSWSISVEVSRSTGHDRSFESTINDAEPGSEYQGGYAVDDARDQAIAAKRAAIAILNSGKVGLGTFRVNMNGHANEGHAPNDYWANDMVTVSISQVVGAVSGESTDANLKK
jgi:hypothetical protein